MKKLFLVLLAAFMVQATVDAQRIAYVDVNLILESIPDYREAQRTLDQTAEQWKQEITQEYNKIDEMYRKYQAEQVLLSDAARQQREDEIINKEKVVRDLQKRRFGPEGELFQKRQELVKPIQDKVYSAIEEFATDRSYDFIFDKSAGITILFANPQYDKTQDILKKLGVN